MKKAGQDRDKIFQEVEQHRKEELSKIENRVLQESYREIQSEVTQLKLEGVRNSSQQVAQFRKKLLDRRTQYAQQLFDQVRERLAAFSAGPDYPAWLLKKARKMAERYGDQGGVLKLRPADEKYIADLQREVGQHYQYQTEPSIQLGGLLLDNPEKRYLVDETLDQALEEQKEWFYKHSGFSVSL